MSHQTRIDPPCPLPRRLPGPLDPPRPMIDPICSALSPALYGHGMVFQPTGINPRTGVLFLGGY